MNTYVVSYKDRNRPDDKVEATRMVTPTPDSPFITFHNETDVPIFYAAASEVCAVRATIVEPPPPPPEADGLKGKRDHLIPPHPAHHDKK